MKSMKITFTETFRKNLLLGILTTLVSIIFLICLAYFVSSVVITDFTAATAWATAGLAVVAVPTIFVGIYNIKKIGDVRDHDDARFQAVNASKLHTDIIKNKIYIMNSSELPFYDLEIFLEIKDGKNLIRIYPNCTKEMRMSHVLKNIPSHSKNKFYIKRKYLNFEFSIVYLFKDTKGIYWYRKPGLPIERIDSYEEKMKDLSSRIIVDIF